MKKNLIWILFIQLALLSGCIHYQQVTVLKKDGSGNMFIHYWMKYQSEKDSVLISHLEIFEADSVYSEFSNSFTSIDEVEVYNQKSDSTIHTKVEFSFNRIDSLNQTEVFKISQFSLVDGPEETRIFSQFVPPMATGFGLDKSPRELEYTYYLPGKIIRHNADELDGNKVIWKFSSDDIGTGKYLTASFIPFRLKETPLWVYYSAFVVILVVVYFLFSKRK